MVQVEGAGMIAPSAHVVVLTDNELRYLVLAAQQRQRTRRYAARADNWGQGLGAAIVIPNVCSLDPATAAIMTGCVGEYATTLLINRRTKTKTAIDLKVRPDGDGGIDITVNGLGIDLKTRNKDYGTFLVRSHYDDGKKCSLKADAFAFATWSHSKAVHVHGWLWTRDVEQCEIAKAPGGRPHKNYVIHPHQLLPMTRLCDEIASRELWR